MDLQTKDPKFTNVATLEIPTTCESKAETKQEPLNDENCFLDILGNLL